MFKYIIINPPAWFKANNKVIDDIFELAWKIINQAQNWIINIIFEDDEAIRKLNKTYRSIDNTTDVLSFHYFDSYDAVDKKTIAWEIILSNSKIESQSAEYSISYEEEFYKLLIHSILHLMWYDHEIDEDFAEMNEPELAIADEINKRYSLKIN